MRTKGTGWRKEAVDVLDAPSESGHIKMIGSALGKVSEAATGCVVRGGQCHT